MKFSVKIQPKSSKKAVEQLADGSYKIFVHFPPIDGKANIPHPINRYNPFG
jgi:uncharacterized protein YggU (UPF0235/DUF167 family)